MMSFRPSTREQLVFGVLLLGAIVFLVFVVPIGIVAPGGNLPLALSPRFLPIVLGVAIGGLALLGIAVERWRRRGSDVDLGAPEIAIPAELRVWSAFLILFVTVASVDWVGMVPASVLGFVGLLVLGGERRWWVYLLAGVVFPYAVAAFFEHAVHVPLPAGELFR